MKSPYKIIKAEKLELLKLDYQKVLDQNTTATAFIKEIENGNLDASFSSEVSETEGLTQALLSMQHQLQKIAEEEKQRNWATQGLAMFAEILRSENDNSKLFYQKIISNLVKYFDANQGGLFLVDDEDDSNISIELVSCYAYNKQKYLTKRINPGQGLIGQCYLEKETIFMTDIPQHYVEITSGLGTANPGCLVIVPLKVNEQVHGFVELAGFKPLKPFQVEFLERLGESIASSLSSVKVNHRTKRLLQDTQQQAEAMRAQEEEMRQNMEELSATQEEMARVGAEMEGQLSAINKAMATIEFDLEGNILLANDNLLRLMEYSLQEIEGKHHRIFVSPGERQAEEYQQFWKKLSAGEGVSGEFERVTKSGKEVYIRGVYNPIFDLEGRPRKILKVAYDITGIKEMELQIKNQLEEAHAQEEELRQNMEELSATQEEMSRILQEVQANEKFMQELINATSDTIFTIDRAYRFTKFNKAFHTTWAAQGYDIKPGDLLLDLFDETSLKTHLPLWDRALAGEFFTQQEVVMIGKEKLYMNVIFSPLRNEKQEVTGIAIFAKDITEMETAKRRNEELLKESQQQAEKMRAQEEEMRQNMEELSATQEEMEKVLQEVQASERHTKELMGASKDTIFVVDTAYKLLDFNPIFEMSYKQLGIHIEKGTNILEVLGEGEKEKHKKQYDRVLKGETFEVTEHIPGPDLHFLSSYSPLRNVEGKIYAVAVFAKNVTEMVKINQETEKLLQESQHQSEELKAQEEELRQNMEELSATQEEISRVMQEVQEQEQHFSELLNGSGESIFAIDPNYRVISWNNTFESTYGKNGNGVQKGMDILSVFPPEIKEQKRKLFDRVIAGESIEEINPMENNGAQSIIKARHLPLRNKSGEIVAVGIFLQDVTEQTLNAPVSESLSAKGEEQQANAHSAEVLKGFNVAYDIVNRQFELVEFNTAFKKLMKKHFKVNVHKGMHISSFMKNEKEMEETKKNIEIAFKGESLKKMQKFVVGDRADYVLLKYVPLRNEKGEIERVGVYSEDITETISLMEKNKELLISGKN